MTPAQIPKVGGNMVIKGYGFPINPKIIYGADSNSNLMWCEFFKLNLNYLFSIRSHQFTINHNEYNKWWNLIIRIN